MKTNGKAYAGVCLLALGSCLTLGADAATAIKINSARVDQANATLLIEGVNFPVDGSLDIAIGDTFLDQCTITATSASCSIENTPAAAGGSWNVSLSAGNSPHNNAAIDVYVPSGQVAACYPGDYVSCYPSDRAELNVGECTAGTRTCQGDGTYSACTGAVTPQVEYPDNCGDGRDNDCDGRIDNGCDVLTENPTVFTASATFTLPAEATSVDIAVWGPGGDGRAATYSTGYAGPGGGSGGLSVLEGINVDSGDQFTVNMGTARSAVTRNGVEIAFATVGRQPTGGEGSTLNGNDGGPGDACELPQGDVQGSDNTFGGAGGPPLAYGPYAAGAGGEGGDGWCNKSCTERCGGFPPSCTTVCTVSAGIRTYPTLGEPGLVVVGWQEPTP